MLTWSRHTGFLGLSIYGQLSRADVWYHWTKSGGRYKCFSLPRDSKSCVETNCLQMNIYIYIKEMDLHQVSDKAAALRSDHQQPEAICARVTFNKPVAPSITLLFRPRLKPLWPSATNVTNNNTDSLCLPLFTATPPPLPPPLLCFANLLIIIN